MRAERQKHSVGGVGVLLLTAVFAVCVLLVLLTGADSYRRLTARDTASFQRRTPVQYLATKVRQADAAGCVEVGTFGGPGGTDGQGDTIFLREVIDGAPYVTRLYCYDGSLRELFTEESAQAAPEDGEQVLEASGLEADLTGGLLRVTAVSADGSRQTLDLALRSGKLRAAEGGGAA